MRAIDLLAYLPGPNFSYQTNPHTLCKAPKRAQKIAKQAGISNGRTVGELTERQREALKEAV